jgi:hypothetical protein
LIRSIPHFVLFILILNLLYSLLSVPTYAGEIEGSGKVTVRPLFELSYLISPNKVTIGEDVSISVTIKNNDNIRRIFYIGLAVQDPDGNWQTHPSETVTLEPREVNSIVLHWLVQTPAIVGYYNVKIIVWTPEPYKEKKEISDKFEVLPESLHLYPNKIDYTWIIKKMGAEQIRIHFKEIKITNGFISLQDASGEEFDFILGLKSDFWTPWIYGDTIKVRYFSNKPEFGFVVDRVEERKIPSYYDEMSQVYAARLNGSLISISKEEWKENHYNILSMLGEPLEKQWSKFVLDTIVAVLKIAFSELSIPITLIKDMFEGKYDEGLIESLIEPQKDILKEETKVYLMAKGISEPIAERMVQSIFTAIDLREPIGDFIDITFGSYPIEEKRIQYSFQFAENTLLTFNHVNFIIVKTEENKFIIYVVSNEEQLINNRVEIKQNKATYIEIGTYDQLPQIFFKKLAGK